MLTAMFTKESGITTKLKAKEFMNISMEPSILETGKKTGSTATV